MVEGNGTLIRGSGTVGTDEKHGDGAGVYDVLFNKDVSGCSFEVTAVSSEQVFWAEPGFQGSGSVRVVSHSLGAVAENAPFNVTVFC